MSKESPTKATKTSLGKLRAAFTHNFCTSSHLLNGLKKFFATHFSEKFKLPRKQQFEEMGKNDQPNY